jgi:MFS family permease
LVSVTEDSTQSQRARYLFAEAIVGIFLYVILDIVAQSLPPHYNPVSQAESDLAVGPYGYVMTLNFINRGILSSCFLFGILLTVYSTDTANPRLQRGAYAFAVWSVGALLLAAFPTDVPATPVSWHGAIHLLVAIAAFLGGAFGALYISLGMVGSSPVARARGVALPLAVLSVLLCLIELFGAFVAPNFFANYGGLVERVFLGSVLLWVGVVSAMMLMVAPAKGPPGQPRPMKT